MSVKILITGLCLQGNKGGPALLESIVSVLRRYIPDLEVTVSVPPHEFQEERAWEEYYGVVAVPDRPLGVFIGRRVFRRYERQWSKQYIEALRGVRGVLDMHGIAYVGPPIGTFRQAFDGRFRIFLIVKVFGKPFIGWTQSYGPLSSWSIRVLARVDLLSQQFILCRGEDCRSEVKKVFPGANVLSFPDVATTLPFDVRSGWKYVEKKFGLMPDRIVTVSPSAVVYRALRSTSPNRHVQHLVDLAKAFVNWGYKVVLVPHTYRPNRHDPEVCDYAVAEAIDDELRQLTGIYLIDEDLSPGQLKSIIANADLHVGARYHSLVAALSSGVPAVSLSWHPKYKDLMREYGVDSYVFNAVEERTIDPLICLAERALANRKELAQRLLGKQREIEKQVMENGRLISNVIRQWP